jgi:HSP20 family protein
MMNIIKHKPAFPTFLGNDIDDMFQGFFRPVIHAGLSKKDNLMPAVDIDETDDSYVLMAEIPGFTKEEINVSLNEGQLIIKAEHKEESEKKQQGGSVLKERRYGSFYRSFNFGKSLKEEDITAKYENGVLEMEIPKMAQAKQETKKITVN